MYAVSAALHRLTERFRTRRAVVVLGNHRSGTSALTRVVNLLGATLPGNLMPKTPDNPEGYWESRDVVKLNNALLDMACTAWHDDAPIPDDWFASEAVRPLYRQTQAWLEGSFRDTRLFVLKDPRMCRLVPFWRMVLEEFGVLACFILIVRHPQEVFTSLKVRYERGLAGTPVRAKSDLLWLRHLLEAERATRGLPRSIVTYDALLADWRSALQPMRSVAGLSARPSRATAARIDQFLSGQHRHHQVEKKETATVAAEVYDLLAVHANDGASLDVARLDAVRGALNEVEEAYAPLRIRKRRALHAKSSWHAEVLTRVTERTCTVAQPPLRVLYVSPKPDTRGHYYRVAHPVAALCDAGVEASWVGFTEDMLARTDEADVVVVFRQMWNDHMDQLYTRCQARGIPIGFGVDDLIFDPQILTVKNCDFLRRLDERIRQQWLQHWVHAYRRAVVEADFALVSTKPLAEAAQALGVPAYVLPNGLDAQMIAQADAALLAVARKPSATDGRLRLGYASGTPSHQKDFATVAPMLSALLDERPDLMLTLVGHLDHQEFPELGRHRNRIETRPVVPPAELFREYARFDVNLAPLERGNPFCEAKSALKYFEPALVQVPTVATATLPYRTAIKDSETSFTVASRDAWRTRLVSLIDNPKERVRLGRQARIHALAAFGPEAQRAAALATFQAIVCDAHRLTGARRLRNS